MDNPELVTKPHKDVRRPLLSALAVAVVGGIVVGLTSAADGTGLLAFIASQKRNLVTTEVAIFGIIVVELLGRAALTHFDQQNTRQLGVALRAVIRVIAYMALAIAILSLLSASPALAVGVGGMMGIVIAFSTQNIIGNVFAGMFIAIGRPFEIGDEITVMGNTGVVVDLNVIHTQIDAGERFVLIPNATMLTQAIQRTKRLPPYDEG